MYRQINLFVSIYARLLRLYPRAFYAAYADEMIAVFTLNLNAVAAQGRLAMLCACLREIFDLPANLLHEHLRKDTQPMHLFQLRGENGLRRARNLTRAASLVVAFFINWSLLAAWSKPDYAIWSQSVPFVVALFLTNVLLLVAWRWERLGARLLFVAAAGVGLTCIYSVLVTAANQNVTISPFVLLFVALTWAFPYVLFGLLFFNFSRRTALSSA
jgi:hypothetical protein